MRPNDLAHETWSALSANKARSALTILGIVIGIGAVITMTSIIGGISTSMGQMLGANGARIITIALKGIDNFSLDDVEEVKSNVSGYEKVFPVISKESVDATYGKKKYVASLKCTSSDYIGAYGFSLLQGQNFTKQDEEQGNEVIVLEQHSVKNLFGSTDAQVVGKSIKLGNDEYRIVGVADKFDSFSMAQYFPDSITGIIPFTTASTRLLGSQSVTTFNGLVQEGVDPDGVAAQTSSYLQKRYKLQDETEEGAVRTVSARTSKSEIEQMQSVTSAFQMIMVSVSSISLLVGGIGIMNMMLTNVTERIREIGLRKALGARRIDITSQFILESVCLCLVGGFIGVVLGLAGAFALCPLIGSSMAGATSMLSGGSITPVADPMAILNAVGTCILVGLIFGWYPAQRASKLDPVESLNHQ